jgi:hypothetical protein
VQPVLLGPDGGDRHVDALDPAHELDRVGQLGLVAVAAGVAPAGRAGRDVVIALDAAQPGDGDEAADRQRHRRGDSSTAMARPAAPPRQDPVQSVLWGVTG